MSSESTDQLRNLGEEEEDFDQLNNETFGELSNSNAFIHLYVYIFFYYVI